VVALLAVGTVAHALVGSVRRDMAILKALGFVRGQVSAMVAWQATTFALVALLAGLPLGVAAGRWGLAADRRATRGRLPPVWLPLPMLAIAAGTVVAANLLAAPGLGRGSPPASPCPAYGMQYPFWQPPPRVDRAC